MNAVRFVGPAALICLVTLNPNFRNAYVNRGNARLRLLQVGAALDDFHHVGMHPERLVAMLGGAVLLAAAGVVVAKRGRLRRAHDMG